MAINPKIKQKAEDIRKKTFGAEVRESLASGLEAMSEDVESIKGRQGNVDTISDSKIYFAFKDTAIKTTHSQNGGTANAASDTITVANDSTGSGSYLMYRQKIDGKKYVGKTLRMLMHVDVDDINPIYTAIVANVHRGSTVVYNVGTNYQQLAQADGTQLYSRDLPITAEDTEFEAYLNISNTVATTSEQIISVKEVVYEIIDNNLLTTTNTSTLDAKLFDAQEKSLLESTIKYSFLEHSKIGGAALNNSKLDFVNKKIFIPAGAIASPDMSFEVPIKKYHAGNTLRVTFEVIGSTSQVGINSLALNTSVVRDGVITVSGGHVYRDNIIANRFTLYRDVKITAQDTSLIANLQILNPTGLANDYALTINDASYKIIDGPTGINRNEVMLVDTLEGWSGIERKIYNSDTLDNKEVDVSTAHTNHLVFEYISGYDVSFRAYGLYANGEWLQLPFTNLATGNSFDYVVTLGEYYLDVSDFTRVKFVNKNSWQYASPFTATVSSKQINKIPHQIVGYNYRAKDLNPIITTPISTAMLFLTAHNGKLYVSAAEAIKYSDDDGLDGYVHTAGVVTGSVSVEKLLILDNGNAMAWGSNGKVFTSTNNMATWTQVVDLGTASTPHSYGTKVYKNYVMFGTYNNVVDEATKVYISEDYGVTVRKVFDILEQTGFEANGIKKHVHSVAIDPYEKTADGKPMLWVTIGDGKDQQMIFWSKDFGATWQQATPKGSAPIQSTEIIPLKNCVLFTSDSRVCGVIRYNRPKTGTRKGKYLDFEMPLLLKERWGYDGTTDVPIATTPAIDYDKSLAYFGWYMGNDGKPGDDSGIFKRGEIYATDGYNFYKVYEHSSVIDSPSNIGVADIYLDGNRVVADVWGVSLKILNHDMWV